MVSGLKDESVRWVEIRDQLSKDYENIIGNIILGAGFMTYAGPLNEQFRKGFKEGNQEMLKLQEVPVSPNFKIETILTNEIEIRDW